MDDKKIKRMINKNRVVKAIRITLLILLTIISSLLITAALLTYINKKKELSSKMYATLFFVFFILSLLVFSIFLFLPFLSKKEKGLIGFIKEHGHSIAFGIVFVSGVILTIAIESQSNMDKISELISVEWGIYGISTAFFIAWNAIFINKNRTISNLDDKFGLNRLKEIRKINSLLENDNKMIYQLVLITLNAMFLILTTVFYYVIPLNDDSIRIISSIALYFCTTTMGSIFAEVVLPMLEIKSNYESEVEKMGLKEEKSIVYGCVLEEAVLNEYMEDLKKTQITDEKIIDAMDIVKEQLLNIIRMTNDYNELNKLKEFVDESESKNITESNDKIEKEK